MSNIKLYDCTIHEGGYKNKWKFCRENEELQNFIEGLSNIGADYFDVGVIGDSKNQTGCCSYETFCDVPEYVHASTMQYVLTILEYEKLSYSKIVKVNGIDYVQIVINSGLKKEKLSRLIDLLKQCEYKVILNIESQWNDSIDCIKDTILDIQEYGSELIIIDDVYGLLGLKSIKAVINELDKKMDSGIGLGIRLRDYTGNTQMKINEFLKCLTKRNIVIQASLNGISRNISLLELENVVNFLNEEYGTAYDISKIDKVSNIQSASLNYVIDWKVSELSRLIASYGVTYDYRAAFEAMHLAKEEVETILKGLTEEEKEKVDTRKCYQLAQRKRREYYEKKIAILIWIDSEEEQLVERYLEKEISNIVRSEIDIYFCNITSNTPKSKVISKYQQIGNDNLKYIDNKKGMLDVLRQLTNKYQYIWMNQSEYIIDYYNIEFVLRELLSYSLDLVVIENSWENNWKKGLYLSRDVKEMFKDNFLNIYRMGTTIYSTKFLKELIKDENKQEFNEIDLTRKVFEYIVSFNGKVGNYYGSVYSYDQYAGIFSINNYTKKWTVCLHELIDGLPEIYDEYKKDVINSVKEKYKPFNKYRKTYLLWKKKKVIKKYYKFISENNKVLLYIPSIVYGYMVKNQHNRLGRWVDKGLKKIRFIKQGIVQSFGKYSGIDYDKYVNCVVSQKQVPSDLIYGDLDYIRDPWMTIVIPTYKRADLLEEAIHSVLTQEEIKRPWDIVIVDNEEVPNGQMNDTEKLIRMINNPRILYYRNRKNLGVAGNYNRGIELARSKWIALLHSDDLLVQGYLKRMSKLIEVYSNKLGKDIGYISSAYQPFYTESVLNDKLWETEIRRRDYLISERQKERPAILTRVRRAEFMLTGAVGISLPSNGTVMNRRAILEYGGFNDDLGISADMVLPLRLMKKYAVYRTDEIMGHYRVGKSNISASSDNSYKVEKNYYDIREYYYRKCFGGKIMGLLFRQQHFFVIDNILGKPYRVDPTLHQIYQYREQKIRDFIMFSRFGILNNFYRIQNKWSNLKGRIMTRIFWKD